MNWNHDLSQAPRGKMVPYTRKGKDGPVQSEQYRKEYILAVDEHGVVSQSYWIPPRYTQSGSLLEGNRWSGFNPGVDPIAWAPWPVYEFKAAPDDAAVTSGNDLRKPVAAEQGQIIREGDAPRGTDRASGDAPGPDTDHLILEDVGSGA
ncbi:hypothetical protein [Agrobacterium pusense]|uniref:hypothetical protein n=1 Tax=Agrobacterium pusense TaxID=648995 RepID=UPI0005142D9C|nr:hypothetical protein [Agrobacterium pusense]ANV26857.1 hypothetical protein BA939_23565 [Rhizobium sp. S41]KGE80417.1 hypothetical protein LW14_23380 [Rhizobium sp. H41]QWW75890.1 hypothetical protein KP800_21880 [Agrobacterium pusense]